MIGILQWETKKKKEKSFNFTYEHREILIRDISQKESLKDF